jgi:rRNA maturation RNase YbeY
MTDVISFDYSSESIVNGEIYLSIDTIRRNAERYGSDMTDEVIRVMFHGLLHLCGYNDKGKEEREIMHEMQEKRLKEYKEYLNEI